MQSKPQTNALAAPAPATKDAEPPLTVANAGTKTTTVCRVSLQFGIQLPNPWVPCKSVTATLPNAPPPRHPPFPPPNPGKHQHPLVTLTPFHNALEARSA